MGVVYRTGMLYRQTRRCVVPLESGRRAVLCAHSSASVSAGHMADRETPSLSEQVELPAVASVSASVIKSPSDPTHVSAPAPPLLIPAASTRSSSTSLASSTSSLENKPPQAIVKPQILTHVIEGFVIQEGLEPFPVSRKLICVF